MGGLTDMVLKLMGFVLAHACWIVADMPQSESFAPFAIIESDQGRELVHFEAETQAQAVAKGQAMLKEPPAAALRIAFVHDALANTATGKIDALVVTGWDRAAGGIQAVKTYRRTAEGRFQLMPGTQLSQDGAVIDGDAAPDRMRALLEGVGEHPEAAKLWGDWIGQK